MEERQRCEAAPRLRRMSVSDVPAVAAIFDTALGAGYVDAHDLLGYATHPWKTGYVAEDTTGRIVAAATGFTAPTHALMDTIPADQVPALLALIPELSGPGSAGLLKSVAVCPRARRSGLGRAVSGAIVEDLSGAGASLILSIGWTDQDGCHIEGTLLALGFNTRGDLPGFWTEDSVQHGYSCPTCGYPCRCIARIFSR